MKGCFVLLQKKINILRFAVILGLYLLAGFLFNADRLFYEGLNKPLLAPPMVVYLIGFLAMSVLISVFFTWLIDKYGYNTKTKFSYLLIFLNYIFIFIFQPLFFGNNLYLGFAAMLFAFTAIFILFIETFLYNKRLSYLLLPVLLWLAYLTYLCLQLYLLN